MGQIVLFWDFGLASFLTGFENVSQRLSVSISTLKTVKNFQILTFWIITDQIFFDLSPKCIKLPTVQKKQAVMEKYRYRSDHHLKKKIKNIRNLVTYRFAEKTFALLTVIGTDTTPILHQYNTHTSLQPFDIEQKLLVPVIFLYSHYLSPQFTLFLKLLFFKDMSLEYQQNIKSMYTNKNLFRINKMLIEFSWHYLGFNHGSPIIRTYKI